MNKSFLNLILKPCFILTTWACMQFYGLHAQLIVNGDFEANGNNCNGPSGWRTNNNVQVANVYQFGNNWIDITGCASGNGNWMEQDVTVVPGYMYFLTMDLGSWFGWDDEDAGVFVTIDGVQLGPRYFNDSFTGSLSMKLHWESFRTCAFIAQKSKVTVRFTGHGLCTKNSPQRACDNPNPGVIAVDNVAMHAVEVITQSKVCMNNGKANLTYQFKGETLEMTREWFKDGVSLGSDSVLTVANSGTYVLKLSMGCLNMMRQIEVGKNEVHENLISLCSGQSIVLKGKTINTSLDILDTFIQSGNCDSIVLYKIRVSTNANLHRTFKYLICETRQDSIIASAPPALKYLWMPGGDTIQTKVLRQYGNYDVEFTDSNGCVGNYKYQVDNICKPFIFIPTAFSPNKDGMNEVFAPFFSGSHTYQMQIFNRWGELIYDSFDTNKGWDGYYRGSLCQQSVYLYLISFSTLTGKLIETSSGTFTLLR